MEMESVSVFSSYNFMANSPQRGSSSRSGLRLHGSSAEAASDMLVTSDQGGLWATHRCICTVFKEEEEKEEKKRRESKMWGGQEEGKKEEEEGQKIKEKQEEETAEIEKKNRKY